MTLLKPLVNHLCIMYLWCSRGWSRLSNKHTKGKLSVLIKVKLYLWNSLIRENIYNSSVGGIYQKKKKKIWNVGGVGRVGNPKNGYVSFIYGSQERSLIWCHISRNLEEVKEWTLQSSGKRKFGHKNHQVQRLQELGILSLFKKHQGSQGERGKVNKKQRQRQREDLKAGWRERPDQIMHNLSTPWPWLWFTLSVRWGAIGRFLRQGLVLPTLTFKINPSATLWMTDYRAGRCRYIKTS